MGEFSERSREIEIVLAEIAFEIPRVPEAEKLRYLREKVAPYPVQRQKDIIAAFTVGYGEGRRIFMENREIRQSQERRLGFLWGVAFIIMEIVISFFIPRPTAWQYTLYRIVLSLAAAGFTNYIEGMLKVRWKWLRAAGPLAVFVIVYYVAPAALLPTPER